MSPAISVLLLTAASIGFFHTLFGPDHYLPFIVMAKSRQWSYTKTILITILCGLGHVLSSVVLGLIGVALGVAVEKIELFESTRGEWAAWALIAFGLTYLVYGIHRALRNKSHSHSHLHGSVDIHNQEHMLSKPIPWALFIVFVLGPCEPLIPILMYPAAQKSIAGMILVASVFSVVTITTMLGVVLISTFGMNLLPLQKFERFSHAFAGCTILFCGIAIRFLGL